MVAGASRLSIWNRLARCLGVNAKTPGERFLKLAAEARERIREVPPEQARRAIGEGALFVDVRERGEFLLRHAAGVEHLGRGTIELEIESLVPDLTTPMVCYCSGGNRSALVADNLQRMGYRDVLVVQGGLGAWIKAGLPTSSEREAMD